MVKKPMYCVVIPWRGPEWSVGKTIIFFCDLLKTIKVRSKVKHLYYVLVKLKGRHRLTVDGPVCKKDIT